MFIIPSDVFFPTVQLYISMVLGLRLKTLSFSSLAFFPFLKRTIKPAEPELFFDLDSLGSIIKVSFLFPFSLFLLVVPASETGPLLATLFEAEARLGRIVD